MHAGAVLNSNASSICCNAALHNDNDLCESSFEQHAHESPTDGCSAPAGMAQGSEATPAHANPTSNCQTPPAAPQRQDKAAVPASTLAGLQKLQLQTPAALSLGSPAAASGVQTTSQGSTSESAEAACLSASATDGHELAGTASPLCSAKQKDVKAMIHQEFARLMATKKYTPNEAALLALQKIT